MTCIIIQGMIYYIYKVVIRDGNNPRTEALKYRVSQPYK